jgi:hypothetical protein
MSSKKKRKTRADNGQTRGNSPATRARSRNRPDDFNPDYSYVKKDLRTIGILAGIFITILVVLSFFI